MNAPELVGTTEVANRLGLTTERIRQIAALDPLFPAPVGQIGRQNIWSWEDVQKWAVAVGRI